MQKTAGRKTPSRKRQHAVPKFYLDRFSDGSGYVSAHDKINLRTHSRISTKNITVESDFYTLRHVTEDDIYYVEEALGNLETTVAEIMREVVRQRTVEFGDHTQRRSTRVHLSFFLAYMIARSHKFRAYNLRKGNEYYQGDGVHKLYEDGPPPGVEDENEYYEALLPFLGGMRRIDDDRDSFLSILFGVGNDVAPHFDRDFRWILVSNPNHSNITCDLPIGCLSMDDTDGDLWRLGVKNIANLWLPIDSDFALLLTKAPSEQSEYLVGRPEPLERWNQILRQRAHRWVIWKGNSPAEQVDLRGV